MLSTIRALWAFVMVDFGEFTDFIASTPLCVDYPYLSDVARLEWHMHREFHARDALPLDVRQLQEVRLNATLRCALSRCRPVLC